MLETATSSLKTDSIAFMSMLDKQASAADSSTAVIGRENLTNTIASASVQYNEAPRI